MAWSDYISETLEHNILNLIQKKIVNKFNKLSTFRIVFVTISDNKQEACHITHIVPIIFPRLQIIHNIINHKIVGYYFCV